eukprot:CAMPEP_0174363144 /NCGR_PEP_ID=MMETSP0811_2-20130205/67520_1 /TAXON_ID=73025 ORGANISM="Eutreptiella gymnastica-like, Strain CCMP1594" /NCGR_SAMPLE_ID=MMETSP0811_2 /ASSEMBLY_ACC=CAM_ASM_000667 /LENGTH=77 /DNA_ID=CAMNT_0015501527 /DNA_START=41 /DNA_END=274 /DNA_ORIENTATION=+
MQTITLEVLQPPERPRPSVGLQHVGLTAHKSTTTACTAFCALRGDDCKHAWVWGGRSRAPRGVRLLGGQTNSDWPAE